MLQRWVAVFVILALGSLSPCVCEEKAEASFAVFGYLPEYRLHGFDYDAAFETGLSHLIFFSLEIDKNFAPSALDRLPPMEDARRARKAADNVGGKILLSFGGNARSAGFGAMARTAATRSVFLEKLDKLLVEYQFDGVDYNWEYPRDQAEWESWGELMKESKEQLLASTGRDNIVTFTMYLDENHYRIIDHFDLLRHADYVHCMAYDSHGKHSTKKFAAKGIDLAYSTKGNFLPEKFTLGVPFYARHVKTGHPMTFYELAAKLVDGKETLDQLGDFYFNNRHTIRRKTEYAMKKRIGGIMIWELGQDLQPLSNPKSLMSAIKEAVSAPREASQNEDKNDL